MTAELSIAFNEKSQAQAQAFNLVRAAKLEGTSGPVYSLDWSPDGRWLATAGYGQVKIWDAMMHKEAIALQGHTSFIWGLAWSPDGSSLAACGQDGSVKLYDSANWQKTADLETEWAFCVAWSPDGKHLVVGTASSLDETRPETFSGRSQIWDVQTHQMVQALRVPSLIFSTTWSPHRRAIATGQFDGKVTIWDSETGVALKSLAATSERSDVNGLAWSPDGSRLAAAQQDGKVRIWNPETGELQTTFNGRQGWFRGLAWSPDGKMLAAAGQEPEILVWRIDTGQQVAELAAGDLPIWSLKWSPDGHWLAAGNGLFGNEVISTQVLLYKVML